MIRRLLTFVLAVNVVSAEALEFTCPWQQDDPYDQVGASRTQTPQKALQAIRLVKTGEVFSLGHVYDEANAAASVQTIANKDCPFSLHFGEWGRLGNENCPRQKCREWVGILLGGMVEGTCGWLRSFGMKECFCFGKSVGNWPWS